jgi:hypothetical protein
MTCAGISSLIIAGQRRFQGQEYLQGETIANCGKGGFNRSLQFGINWMARNFYVGQNFGMGMQWKYYYLYGLERAGRLAGIRFFGPHDWYRVGAEELVHSQDRLSGFWRGALLEGDHPVLATSFALLFWPRDARRCWSTSWCTRLRATGTTTSMTCGTWSASSLGTGRAC